METPMKQLIEEALKNINSVADVNTVIGEPVTLPNGVTVVPFSKVSVGFATGGTDRNPKTTDRPLFAGGSGAGVSVVPMGFLVIGAEGNVTLLDLKNPDSYTTKKNHIEKLLDGANSLMDRAPDMIAKCKDAFGKKQETQETQETEEN